MEGEGVSSCKRFLEPPFPDGVFHAQMHNASVNPIVFCELVSLTCDHRNAWCRYQFRKGSCQIFLTEAGKNRGLDTVYGMR
ncbi:hypothetical protein CEXT_311 [Caerostris extrusa]|uniref:Apple domain-containing protein n=1 Tax=Caerostris extrusa TaxID=172846 RepID=A0AAV4W0F5_CAEEX|nr:hypothetical protein CEXT_311 [Caerostris extrusa]